MIVGGILSIANRRVKPTRMVDIRCCGNLLLLVLLLLVAKRIHKSCLVNIFIIE